jgi:hypothetical protein
VLAEDARLLAGGRTWSPSRTMTRTQALSDAFRAISFAR